MSSLPDGKGDGVDQAVDEPGAGQTSQEDEPEPQGHIDLCSKKNC